MPEVSQRLGGPSSLVHDRHARPLKAPLESTDTSSRHMDFLDATSSLLERTVTLDPCLHPRRSRRPSLASKRASAEPSPPPTGLKAYLADGNAFATDFSGMFKMATRRRWRPQVLRQPALLSLRYRSPLCLPRPTATGSRCSSATAVRCARHGRLTIGLMFQHHRSPLCLPRPTDNGHPVACATNGYRGTAASHNWPF